METFFTSVYVVSISECADPAAEYINNLAASNGLSGGLTPEDVEASIRFIEREIESCSSTIRGDFLIEIESPLSTLLQKPVSRKGCWKC